MTVSTLGASLSISQGNLVYVPSQLTASLTGELRREIALADIDAVDAVQPTAAASGRIVISFADTKSAPWTITFAPNQEIGRAHV